MCRGKEADQPCFALGRRRPFAGHTTYLWLRYHQATPQFDRIRKTALAAATEVGSTVVFSGGNVWIPIHVELDEPLDVEAVADEVVSTVEAVEAAIWPGTP